MQQGKTELQSWCLGREEKIEKRNVYRLLKKFES